MFAFPRGANTCLTLSSFAAYLLLLAGAAGAAVLPEDRADVMYHSYEGGGVTIDGPSVLVRKGFAGTVSFSANHYVDNVSSASIDVKTYASEATRYTEERTEQSFGVDYLRDKTVVSAGLTESDENDYQAETVYFSISQDMFGDLTTVTMGYAQGDDEVGKNYDPNFGIRPIDRQNYRLGISQILTPTLIIGLDYEAITEEGYLNNPYRNYRYRDPNQATGYSFGTEVYPNTRTSDAAALRLMYYLPWRASLKGEYRHYTDDWDVKSHTYQLTYTHPIGQRWIVDVKLRAYEQQQAEFYSDLHQFPSADPKDWRARDKELSEFTSATFGLGVSYEFSPWGDVFDRGSLNFQWERIEYDYDNFRDLTANAPVGEEPLYSFDADVIRAFISVWY